MKFSTFLPIDPLPCPRPRVAVIRGHGVAYYPAAYKKWTSEFVELFKQKQYAKFTEPVRARIILECRKARTSKLLIPSGDVDNYAKSVLDGLTTVGMWDDDKQVQNLVITKRWANPDPTRVGIHIYIDTSVELNNVESDICEVPEPARP